MSKNQCPRKSKIPMTHWGLIRRSSAGKVKHPTRGERAILAGEPGDQRSGFVDFAEPVHWDFAEHIIDVLLGALLEDLGLDDGGGDAVDADAVGGEFFAEAFCEGDDARLGSAVGTGFGVAFFAGDGGGVDDASVAAFA